MEVSRQSSCPRTAGSWGGIVVIIVRSRCLWVSRIPWTFVMGRYFRKHVCYLFYSLTLSIHILLALEQADWTLHPISLSYGVVSVQLCHEPEYFHFIITIFGFHYGLIHLFPSELL